MAAAGGIFLIRAPIRGPRAQGFRRNRPPSAKFALFDRKSVNQNANKPLFFGVF
jgi:hypothetical protein